MIKRALWFILGPIVRFIGRMVMGFLTVTMSVFLFLLFIAQYCAP